MPDMPRTIAAAVVAHDAADAVVVLDVPKAMGVLVDPLEEARTMTEPIFVAQTAEAEHLENPLSWWKAQAREAVAKGATWPRFSWREDGSALLIEAWAERPSDEGPQRWAMTH